MSGTQADAGDDIGKFGYETLDIKQHIPYIFRAGEKVCATKVFQWHIDRLNIKLNPALAQFPYLMGHEMNRCDAILYNEINQWHNNTLYPFLFRVPDTLVKLSDVCDIFKFVQDCDKKTKLGEQHAMDAGLIHIKCTAPGDTDDEPTNLYTVWPYISKDKKRYVPIAFLTDSSSTLSATIVLEGIDVMYMRYLYVVLKCDIPKSEFNIPCVELDDALAKALSATDVTYECDDSYWPTKKRSPPPQAMPLSVLLGSHIKKLNNNNVAFFTQSPTNMDRAEKALDAVTTTNTTTTATTVMTPTTMKMPAEMQSSESESDINDANGKEKENQKVRSVLS